MQLTVQVGQKVMLLPRQLTGSRLKMYRIPHPIVVAASLVAASPSLDGRLQLFSNSGSLSSSSVLSSSSSSGAAGDDIAGEGSDDGQVVIAVMAGINGGIMMATTASMADAVNMADTADKENMAKVVVSRATGPPGMMIVTVNR